ncbi:gephyrin-like molybdotransferase Glp [Geomicrobium sp. JCM 19038]|uniref:molybdopterin molybdotransferase MoeA n=1 Tax=Geomicrobium sp. JCM 19038 TaxID=1460635 RepID=UPI00045F1B31|nr:gephyrin-like molybdotransferase Glp [Geomicrobium sp. JCM 19038]GAK10182.1 molybdopterin biosynthesis protein MoeA [Geomicrobium sp. JCM 19038]
MVEVRRPISISDAVSRVMNYEFNQAIDYVPLLESDLRFLAEDLLADHDVPPFNRAPYDGYAIRSEDTSQASRQNPTRLHVVGDIGAGSLYTDDLENGQAVRIMTGAQMPSQSDAVVMLEEIHTNEADMVTIIRPHHHNENISFQGEDTKKDQVLIEKGAIIHPGTVALLATFGYDIVPVFRKPRIGILATGSELLDVHEPLQPGKIRNSNAYMAASQVKRAGGIPVMYGKLPDELDACVDVVTDALQEVDAMITTGGASVGDYDLVPQLVERLHATTLFNKVAMRPGSVTTVAEKDGQLIYGLSGNPGACYVGFELFVRPLIRKALGARDLHLKRSIGVLDSDHPKPNPYTRLIRGVALEREGVQYVKPSGLDKSSSVIALGEADVLIVLPAGSKGYKRGEEVNLLDLHDQKGSQWPWDIPIVSYK